MAVFLAGAALLGLEIAASRVLAPYFGNSLYVWGALIGVVLAGLSTGYWIGGAFRGRGFGAEAVAGIVALLRRRFPHRLIVAECRPENTASCGLLRKAGFRDTGDEGHRPGRRIFVIEPA